MNRVVLDTSVIIDHLRGKSQHLHQLEQLQIERELELLIPNIVITELFAGQEAARDKPKQALIKLINGYESVGLSKKSAIKAGELIRKYTQIPDPFDFLIAAIAHEQQAQIATHNQKHFREINEVSLYQF